jgi:hypothetical protein
VRFAERGKVLPQYLHPYLSVLTLLDGGAREEADVELSIRLSVFCTEIAVEGGGELDRLLRLFDSLSTELR